MQGRIGKDIQVAPKAKILLVVRQELQMIAQIAIYINRILNIKTIECHRVLADGARERELKQAYLIIIQIDIGKYILQRRVENVAR